MQTDNTTAPAAVLSGKTPNVSPGGSLVSVFPGNHVNAHVPQVFCFIDDPRTLLPPHVPLHVLLCVFLN
jgi:hypothetical protein